MSRMELLDVFVLGVGGLELGLAWLSYRALLRHTNAQNAAYDLGYDIGYEVAASEDHPTAVNQSPRHRRDTDDDAICPVVPLRGDPS